MTRARTLPVFATALSVGLLAACTHQGSDRGVAVSPAGAGTASASPAVAVIAPRVSIVGQYAGHIGAGAPITLAVANGKIAGPVTVSPKLSGTTSSTGTGWTSTGTTSSSTTYQLALTVTDRAGRAHRLTASVGTASKRRTLDVQLTPGDGAVVGVGLPVVATFDTPVARADRAAVERRLQVTTHHRLTGAWSWTSATNAHFRPVHYWPAKEPVRVAASLSGLYLPHTEVWGGSRHTTAFTIGSKHYSVADVSRHKLTVYSGDRRIATFPASMGSPRYPSKGGVHIAVEKSPTVIMDSSTIGIPRNGPGGYYETVNWDVRISYGGAFVHSAPWSVGAQGNTNVSHGCVNLAPSNARWFYEFTQRGDIVNVVHAVVGPDAGDPGTVDWNMSWKTWLASSGSGARLTA